jgi:hypothetical protein
VELLERLEPSPDVRERVERFHREHFRPEMIGVHLRRGDMPRVRPDGAGNAAAAVDFFLSRGTQMFVGPGAARFRTSRCSAGACRLSSVRRRFPAISGSSA